MITANDVLPVVMLFGAVAMVFTLLGLFYTPFFMAALVTVGLMGIIALGSIAYFEWKR